MTERERVIILRRLINGEWVDKDLVCGAMGISGSQAMQMFEYGRMAKWNKPPLNGQRIVEKLRIGEKTIRKPKPFWMEDDFPLKPYEIVAEPIHNNDDLELVLEQQGGII